MGKERMLRARQRRSNRGKFCSNGLVLVLFAPSEVFLELIVVIVVVRV